VSFATSFQPARAELPPNIDVDEVVADLAGDHVAAEGKSAKETAELVDIVEQAQSGGIELSIVVVPANPRHDSMLRDLATEIGKQEGGTVVVLSPDWIGTFSTTISRVQLETAEDPAKNQGGNSTVAAQKFTDELMTDSLPWTAITAVLLAVTVAVVAGLYVVKSRTDDPVVSPSTEKSETPD
jgi:hypothetical protein